MDIHVTLQGEGDLTERVYRQLVGAILDGRLQHGQQLPPSRSMARQLQVSRNTVMVAYDRLNAEGYTRSRVGAGTFVVSPPTDSVQDRRAHVGAKIDIVPFWQDRTVIRQPEMDELIFNFAPGVADERHFPWDMWRRILAGLFRDRALEGREYSSPAGSDELRAAIARHVTLSRSVLTSAEDVLVTNGSQHAIDLLARVLIQPGDVVAMEDPGYFPVRYLMESHGAFVQGVPTDRDGLIVEALPEVAKVVYVTPSHQFPMGMPMSLERRFHLLSWADRHNAVIVEDDYDSEFRFDERPLDPLQSIDQAGRVVYVGTFSKSLMPSLRAGFMVVPRVLRTPLMAARQAIDWHSDLSTQLALAEFISGGYLARHIHSMLRIYAERHSVMVRAIHRWLTPYMEQAYSMAGLHITVIWRDSTQQDEREFTRLAAERGLLLRGLSHCCMQSNHPGGFVLGFGNIETNAIEPGIREIARLLQEWQQRHVMSART